MGRPPLRLPEIVLASGSRYRREQLARLGLPFRVRAADVDEAPLQQSGAPPEEIAARLARAKAQAVLDLEPGAVVIGADQLATIDGRVLGKPGSREAAAAQLAALAGRTHSLITALAVAHGSAILEHLDVTRLTMRALAREEIERYVAADDPTDCAGAYKLESRGIALFEAIDSKDHSAITGLPLLALTSMLRRLGFRVP